MGILYDRNARPGHNPVGATGQADLRTGQGHSTQWYADGQRFSWDHNPVNDIMGRPHLTNQNVPKGSPGRHPGK